MSRAHWGSRCCQASKGRSEEGPVGCASTHPGQSESATKSAGPSLGSRISRLYSTGGRKDKKGQRRVESLDGLRLPLTLPSPPLGERDDGSRLLDVVVEGELVRMRPQAGGMHLVLPLVRDPGIDEIRSED